MNNDFLNQKDTKKKRNIFMLILLGLSLFLAIFSICLIKSSKKEESYAATSTYWVNYYNYNGRLIYNQGAVSATGNFTLLNSLQANSLGFTRTGYTLRSWGVSTSSVGSVYSLGAKVYVSSLTFGKNDTSISINPLYDANTYTISFSADEGTGSNRSVTATYGETCPDISSFTAPTRPGYKFTGYSSSSGVKYYDENGKGVRTYNYTSSQTLYADWKGVYKYNLLYYASENDYKSNKSMGSTTVTIGDYITIPTPFTQPTKEGYKLTSWYDKNLSTSYTGNFKITVPYWGGDGASASLVANWTPITYNVAFDPNGGNILLSPGTKMSNIKLTYDTPSLLPENKYSKTGYLFAGWSTEKIDGTDYVSGIEQFTDKSEVVNLSTIQDSTITLYAVWKPITYTIKFKSSTAVGSMSNMTCTYDVAERLPHENFTRNNYIFAGWLFDKSGSLYLYDEMEKVKNLTTVNGAVLEFFGMWSETWANRQALPAGKGTVEDPYLISKAEELAWMSWYTQHTGSLSGYFKQTANIDLSGCIWAPIGGKGQYKGVFMGKYDGCGYTIKGFESPDGNNRSNEFWDGYGLFGATKNATIKNIRLFGEITHAHSRYIGSIAGWLEGTIENCSSFMKISNQIFNEYASTTNNYYTDNYYYAGGIVGFIYSGNVTGCYYQSSKLHATYSGDNWKVADNIGGIAGGVKIATISNCYANCESINSNNINGRFNLGGIVGLMIPGVQGDNELTLSSCYFEGYFTSLKTGINTSVTESPANYGEYKRNIGGLVGEFVSEAEIVNCYIKIKTNFKEEDIGGPRGHEYIYLNYPLVGYNNSDSYTISDCIFETWDGASTDYTKRCLAGSTYSDWLITDDGRVYPTGLSWLASGGDKVTSIDQIVGLGYTAV